MAKLQLNDVYTVFDKTIEILHGVSLEVKEGSIAALLGPNGAGKTVTLNTISGVIALERGRVTKGSIGINNSRIENKKPWDITKMGISYSMWREHLFSDLTTEENLICGAHLLKSDEINDRLETVYQYFPALKEKRNTQTGYLSGGQQQMLIIGRALVGNPKLLLLDEPSQGLAPTILKSIYKIIEKINQEEGISMLIAEQNTKMALDLADHAYIITNGKIVNENSADEMAKDENIIKMYFGG